MKLDRVRNSEFGMRNFRKERTSFRTPHRTNGAKTLRNEPIGPRKGQFFLISAITIVLILYGLSDLLKMQFIDATGVQSSTLPGIAMALEYNLNATVVSSSSEDLAKNLGELIAFEREYLKGEGYALDVTYNVTSVPRIATILLTAPGVYYEKSLILG